MKKYKYLGILLLIIILAIIGGSMFFFNHNNRRGAQTQTRLNIEAKNGRLHGRIYTGNAYDKSQSLVIYSHGLGDSQASGTDYAKALAKEGYTAYTYNFNHGTISDDMTKMSIFTEENDLQIVVRYFKNQGYQKIFLLGSSQGGVVSAMTAANRKDVAGIILFYPAFVLRDQMLDMFPDNKFPKNFNLMGMELGREYLKNLPDYNLLNEVTRYQGPVLIVHGTSDSVAPIHYSEDVNFKNKELVKIKGAGHGFYGASQKKATDELIQFIKKNN